MKFKLPLIVLAASAVISTVVILEGGRLAVRFFELAYRATPEETGQLMPPWTWFATQFPGVFVAAAWGPLFAAVSALRRGSFKPTEILALGFSGQGAAVWWAMFCFCYVGFCGEGRVHQEYSFELGRFLIFEGGAFPASLMALIGPAVAVWVNRNPAKKVAAP